MRPSEEASDQQWSVHFQKRLAEEYSLLLWHRNGFCGRLFCVSAQRIVSKQNFNFCGLNSLWGCCEGRRRWWRRCSIICFGDSGILPAPMTLTDTVDYLVCEGLRTTHSDEHCWMSMLSINESIADGRETTPVKPGLETNFPTKVHLQENSSLHLFAYSRRTSENDVKVEGLTVTFWQWRSLEFLSQLNLPLCKKYENSDHRNNPQMNDHIWLL